MAKKRWPDMTFSSVYATKSLQLRVQSSRTTCVICLYYIQKTSSINKQPKLALRQYKFSLDFWPLVYISLEVNRKSIIMANKTMKQ